MFCNVGKSLGAGTVLEYAKRFGFYSLPPLETPENERVESGLYDHGRLFDPKHPDTQVDPGRLAFGQERLQVTPLQMAMVAATIANHGRTMRPQLVARVRAPGGKTITHLRPEQLGQPIKRQTADELTSMMELVVSGGTGTAAQIPGVRVAGKTGTAETGTRKHLHGVVHRVRARRGASRRDCGRRREPAQRLRRGDLRADRTAGDGGAAPVGANPYSGVTPWLFPTR